MMKADDGGGPWGGRPPHTVAGRGYCGFSSAIILRNGTK